MGDITGDGTAVSGLGGPEGYGEVALPRGDTGFAQVDVSAVFEDGFIIDGVAYDGDELFISTDGFVTFGTGVDALPGNPASLTMPVIAPFMADIDTRLDGEGAESGQIWLDVDTVNDCVTITWDDVGFYRRNATFTNTFQVQLYDLGDGTMDVVFRYDSIEWTSGDLQGGSGGLGGTPALIGYRMDSSGALTFLGASGDQAGLLALPTTLGNTGVAGLYVFQMGDGALGDPVEGTAGNDTLAGTDGVDTLLGLGGNDVLFGSAGADVMDGGQGIDRVDFSSAPAAILLDMTKATANQGWAAGDSFLSVENVVGSGFDDVLTGLSNANLFDGGAGHDSLIGQGGDDTLLGQQGHDTLLGGTGNDRLEGSSGNDSGRGGDGDDSLFGGSGNDSLLADKGNDLIDGGDGNDTLAGSHGNDTLIGGKGNDLLQG